MEKEDALVTVIIPTYGGERELERAIDSILHQTYKNFELIVVDDNQPGSKTRANTEKIMQLFEAEPRIKYLKHDKNKNGAAARNTGIREASGKYICFLDDDDFYMPDRLEVSVSLLEKNPEYDAATAHVLVCRRDGTPEDYIEYLIGGYLWREILSKKIGVGSGSNLFLTKKAVLALKGFDESFRRHQDDEFMIRFYKEFQSIPTKKLLLVQAGNGVSNVPKFQAFYETKMKFFKKFEKEIQALDEDDRNYFYDRHYTDLLRASFNEPNSKRKQEAVQKVKSLRKLQKEETLKLLFGDGIVTDAIGRAGKKVIASYRTKKGEIESPVKKCTKEELAYIKKMFHYPYRTEKLLS